MWLVLFALEKITSSDVLFQMFYDRICFMKMTTLGYDMCKSMWDIPNDKCNKFVSSFIIICLSRITLSSWC